MDTCQTQYSPQIDERRTVDVQRIYCRTTASSETNNQGEVSAPREMLNPSLATGMKQSDEFA